MYFGTKTFIILLKLQRQRQQKKLCILLTKCFFSFLPFFYSCNFDFVESKKFFFVQLRLCETKKKFFFWQKRLCTLKRFLLQPFRLIGFFLLFAYITTLLISDRFLFHYFSITTTFFLPSVFRFDVDSFFF